MTPLIETNWEPFDEKENVEFRQMNGWVSEDKSLINRLENKYGTINLEVLSEEETEYSDKELMAICQECNEKEQISFRAESRPWNEWH